ncbi:MAG TPA: 23S rRNA (adenine(2503)-C(2))-methyltransferase RlmN [Flavobacteriales bacterium]|nr:23S rRNA (adenine(2503)-C(2))-methyltransferase RlmN [Flavobacteriales bacterium]
MFVRSMSLDKKNIRTLTLEELMDFFKENDMPTFRAKQVYEWLWKKSVSSFEEMRNVSKETIQLLDEHFVILHAKITESQKSADRTIKSAFGLYDNNNVEGVLIPTKSRMTACISSQVGCSLTCKFCATGKLDRLRNLHADEIYDQIFMLNEQALSNYNQKLSNIVYMGMGEPLLNYRNVLESIDKITSTDGLGMSPKRITVSTAGIAKLIKKLGDDEVKFNLALSLHAANDKKRDYIMPINEQNSLEALKEAIVYFYEKTQTRITYEYIIFKDFNDEISDAQELASFAKITPCKINIIEYNPIDDGEFQQAKREKVYAFVSYLESKNLIVNVRRSRGKDIDAACGQLANKLVKS